MASKGVSGACVFSHQDYVDWKDEGMLMQDIHFNCG